MNPTKSTFFAQPAFVFFSDPDAAEDAEALAARLQEIGIASSTVPCSDNGLMVYHSGDLIYGERIELFMEYAKAAGAAESVLPTILSAAVEALRSSKHRVDSATMEALNEHYDLLGICALTEFLEAHPGMASSLVNVAPRLWELYQASNLVLEVCYDPEIKDLKHVRVSVHTPLSVAEVLAVDDVFLEEHIFDQAFVPHVLVRMRFENEEDEDDD